MHIQGGHLVVLVEHHLPGEHLLEADRGQVLVLYGFDPFVCRQHQDEPLRGQHADVQYLLGEEDRVEDGLDWGSQGLYKGVMQEQVEENREDFASVQLTVLDILFGDCFFILVPKEVRVNWDAEPMLVVFFDLDSHAHRHGLCCEVHSDNPVQVGARELDGLKGGQLRGHRVNLDQGELLKQLVSDQDVVLICADARRFSRDADLLTAFIDCIKCP